MPSTAPAARPAPTEYAPFYGPYVAAVPDGGIIDTLVVQLGETLAHLTALSDEQARHRYAEGKWSIKEVVGHLCDAERIFAYRLLRVARGDATPMPGFDENAYVAAAGFDAVPLHVLLDQLAQVRRGTVALLRTLGDEAWTRAGTANGAPVTARAIAWIIAGHERHHLGVLRERYLR